MGLPVPVSTEFVRDPAQLGREITLLSAQINVANYRLLKLIAEFDVIGGWRGGWKDVAYEAYVRQEMETGLAEARRGEFADEFDVKNTFARWGVQVEG